MIAAVEWTDKPSAGLPEQKALFISLSTKLARKPKTSRWPLTNDTHAKLPGRWALTSITYLEMHKIKDGLQKGQTDGRTGGHVVMQIRHLLGFWMFIIKCFQLFRLLEKLHRNIGRNNCQGVTLPAVPSGSRMRFHHGKN